MSTKIYNGYQLPDWSLRRLNRWADTVRTTVQKVADRESKKLQIALATDLLEQHHRGKLPAGKAGQDWENWSPWLAAYRELSQVWHEVKNTHRRDPLVDLECEAQIIPGRKKLLVLLFCENQKVRTAVEKIPGLKPYCYWDNSDPEPRVSETDWRRRGREWEIALRDRAPIFRGLSFECIGEHFPLHHLQDIPRTALNYDRKKRAFHLARHALLNQVSGQWRDRHPPTALLEALEHASQYLKTKKGKAQLARQQEKILKQLPPNQLAKLLAIPLKPLS